MFTPSALTLWLLQHRAAPDAIDRLVASPGQRQELLILSRVLADLAPPMVAAGPGAPTDEGSTRPGGQTQEEGQAA